MHVDTVVQLQDAKPVLYVDSLDELPEGLKLLGFHQARPVIVILGGASGMTEEIMVTVQKFFENHLLPFAKERNAIFLDGGTDSGVMAALGRARKAAHAEMPLIGVMAREIEGIQDMLESNHSHFIFCSGKEWGGESEWIAAAASALCGSLPSVAVLINGGQITWEDARNNIQYGRSVLVAEGSGRTADEIATTQFGLGANSKALALIRTGKMHVANFFKDPDGFIKKINELMK